MGHQRDRKPPTTSSRPPTPHVFLVADFMFDATATSLATHCPSPRRLFSSPPPPLSPSPSLALLIGQTLHFHLLCECVVSGGAFPPLVVRSVSPSPRSQASCSQSCAFFLYSLPPPATCTNYFLLHDHGTAALPCLCTHVTV